MLTAPVLVRLPEVVAGMVVVALGVAVGVADEVALLVIVADGVATNAGKPRVSSAAKTVKVRTIF